MALDKKKKPVSSEDVGVCMELQLQGSRQMSPAEDRKSELSRRY